ncbi:hypothetical protein A3B87_02790 [Candidatus Kuenenbacteria bacterium RIFCSPHIGHO2_02_FULL_39_13]|uniref:Aspartyl-tRNA amidotransferase n=1 Tax=Candidatus Kuenenbacteria bacterium RIFCSPHIGHO2_02_FULL_39_13 TaxID=1798561 RepID=A0A1F6FNU5_9BACT|nr:MAG: hypothetical protein A3B87_02790 [Candidatus Kuenenbacteria bacterium RIFCSPHIGHO2_02_FULL_39_13]
MSLATTLENDFKNAMLNRQKDLVDLLRLLKAALKNEMINFRRQELSDAEVITILKREAKKRNDSIEQFIKGKRQDLADKETAELKLIKHYLPQDLPTDEVRKVVQEVISSLGEVAPSQFGKVMAAVMARLKGQADGTLVSQIVKEIINK